MSPSYMQVFCSQLYSQVLTYTPMCYVLYANCIVESIRSKALFGTAPTRGAPAPCYSIGTVPLATEEKKNSGSMLHLPTAEGAASGSALQGATGSKLVPPSKKKSVKIN